jgi:hypothetical protein
MASLSRLKPGEKGKINAKLETAGKKGFISKGITVHSNDPKRPVINLTLKANIQ